MVHKALLTCLSVFIILSCGDDHIRTYTLPKQVQSQPEMDLPTNVEPANLQLSWTKPDGWQPSEGSSMRLASFDFPNKGDTGDISLIQLGGDGGGIAANINRWRTQLGLQPVIASLIENEISRIQGKLGEYIFTHIRNEESGQAFLCAIIPSGKVTFFVKMSSNTETAAAGEVDFKSFCSSLHFK
ncbi:MAG: hypothetical protein QGF36_00030 [Candidatus Marinimicrobia bacterium]|nr:hypothetical protein [Candidatus Neomarinimicrobiota bacterium]MDP6935802.1 hypothetical protein [Candidatus Neomarinimicrobiota bacterium]